MLALAAYVSTGWSRQMQEDKLVGAEGVDRRSEGCRNEVSHQVLRDNLPFRMSHLHPDSLHLNSLI